MPALFLPEERWAPGKLGRQPPAHRRAQIHHGLVEAGYGYWGFSPANVPEGGYAVYGVDGIGSDPDGYPSNNDAHADRPRLARLPRAGAAGPAAERVHERRRHPARGVPGAALRAARDADQPRAARARLRHLHALGLPRLGQRRHRRRVGLLPLARPGHDHGRDRQRARPRSAAAGVLDARRGARAAAGDGRRGVQRLAAAVHDHRHAAQRSPARHARRRRDLRPRRRRRRSTAATATTRCSATAAATGSRAATATTRCTAARATTGWTASAASTCCRAARASTCCGGSTESRASSTRRRRAGTVGACREH